MSKILINASGKVLVSNNKVYVSNSNNIPSSSAVIFFDYDGSVVEVWEASSVAGKSALPNNPSHTGLVAQGWNWDLAHIKSYIASYPSAVVNVGQMYKTLSGLTEIDITLTAVTGLAVTCNMVGNKNWGDGTSNALTSHSYADYGDYTITCDGTTIPAGTEDYDVGQMGGMFNSSYDYPNYYCTNIRIGEDVTSIGDYAFYYCSSLVLAVIPQGVTSIGESAFYSCRSLKSATLPQGITSINAYVLNGSDVLTSIIMPSGVTSIGNYAFANNPKLTNVTMPQNMTSINDGIFAADQFTNIVIPNGVTSIGELAFQNCSSLSSITIPQTVTSFGEHAFRRCVSIRLYDFTALTSVPEIYSDTFEGISGLCKIKVPAVLETTWKADENWSAYADYIEGV